MNIDEIIKDLYFGMFRKFEVSPMNSKLYDLGSVQAQTMLNSILESIPDAWYDRQPELKAMNPEGWEIAMVCWSSLECFSSDEYFVNSQKEAIAPDQVYDFFWSLPWEIITKEYLDIINLDFQIEIDSSNQFNIDQWDKWSEVAESMDEFYDFNSEPWNQWIDQNEDWMGEFLNVDWRDQYQDFVEFDLLDRTSLTFYRIPRI